MTHGEIVDLVVNGGMKSVEEHSLTMKNVRMTRVGISGYTKLLRICIDLTMSLYWMYHS